MRSTTITVEMLAVDHGSWCEHCAKSTGVYVAFVQHRPDGVSSAGRIHRCTECGEQIGRAAQR